MSNQRTLPFFTLLLMISFASVNAVLFTPALPNIADFFSQSTESAQRTITWFLIGYASGQLIYGPIANRYGRKPALYLGVGLQIASSLLCVFAGFIHQFTLLIIGRFLLALGSGVGLKMAFTLVNECYEPQIASQKISYLMLAFAVTPALSVAVSGELNANFGWMSCFYAGAIYGFILLLLTFQLPETQTNLNYDALKLKNLFHGYISHLKKSELIVGSLLMGSATSFVYVFAALSPFAAMNLLGMKSAEYGMANILPAIGLIFGSLCSAKLAKKHGLQAIIGKGILITGSGVGLMIAAALARLSAIYSIFLPMIIVYFGLAFIIANASTAAMIHVNDKSHGSAVMNFINMGMATLLCIPIERTINSSP
ncbi:MFS transporter [Aquicella lusitana]|uniref:Putative MFS family arabinose efflux permease n=1 Tax=Aquicella lusitana TaxID=254246 RepID=A0A370GRR6_9COXI|nr:MFS transporter [Aquicella lusitana]RDI46099.1 putative MFS family arabinose efflux permease [Aquicella lusitana]VVC73304.1 Multidrug resistance protein MdtL [Aquicella lusitana]